MGRVLGRVLMAVAGAAAFACYAAAAYLAYRLLRFAVVDRPATLALLPVAVGGALLVGYLNYRFGARRVAETAPTVEPPADRAATLEARLARLCERMDLPEPTLLFTDLETPNGFAMGGPDGGVVLVDAALFDRLDDDAVEALLAHELAHLERRDGMLRALAFTALRTAAGVGTLALSPAILLLMGLAKAVGWFRGRPGAWTRSLPWRVRSAVRGVAVALPAVCTVLLLERSRRLEYAADRRAAAVTGKPLALAEALRTVDDAESHDAEPEDAGQGGDGRAGAGRLPDLRTELLSTHPAVEERVDRLRNLASGPRAERSRDRAAS